MYYKLLLAALFHGLFGAAGLSLVAILNPIEQLVKQFCNDTIVRFGYDPSPASISFLWSFLNACFPLGYLFSTFVIAYCSERFGRKGTTMIVNNILHILACLLMWVSKELNRFELMIIGRIVSGISQQVCVFGFIYIIECSDVANTGMTAMIYQGFGVIWYVLGSAFGLPNLLGREHIWRYIFLIPIPPAIIHLVGAIWMPESPKHLYITKQEKSKSIQAVKFYQGPETDVDKVTNAYEAEMAASVGYKKITIKDILTTKHLKWPFWICMVADFSCRTGGYDIENFYSTAIIRNLGVSLHTAAFFNVFILRFPSIIFMMITMLLVKQLKSRPYLLGTLIGGLVSITLLFLSQVYNHFEPDNQLSATFGVISLFVGISSWHLGAGYMPKFLPGQCCPQISRSLTTAYQVGVRGLTSTMIAVIYPPMETIVGGPITLFPIMMCGYLSVAWLYKYLPETTNKSVNEVVERWIDNSETKCLPNEKKSIKNGSYGAINDN